MNISGLPYNAAAPQNAKRSAQKPYMRLDIFSLLVKNSSSQLVDWCLELVNFACKVIKLFFSFHKYFWVLSEVFHKLFSDLFIWCYKMTPDNLISVCVQRTCNLFFWCSDRALSQVFMSKDIPNFTTTPPITRRTIIRAASSNVRFSILFLQPLRCRQPAIQRRNRHA